MFVAVVAVVAAMLPEPIADKPPTVLISTPSVVPLAVNLNGFVVEPDAVRTSNSMFPLPDPAVGSMNVMANRFVDAAGFHCQIWP